MFHQKTNAMKIHTNYNPYSCDYSKVYVSKDGYHFNGSRYESLSEVKEVYRSMQAVKTFFTGLSLIILSTCIVCAGFMVLSAINIF